MQPGTFKNAFENYLKQMQPETFTKRLQNHPLKYGLENVSTKELNLAFWNKAS